MARKVRGKPQKLAHSGHRQKKDQHAQRTNTTGKKWVNKHAVQDKSDPIKENGDRRERAAKKVMEQHDAMMQAFLDAGGVIGDEADIP